MSYFRILYFTAFTALVGSTAACSHSTEAEGSSLSKESRAMADGGAGGATTSVACHLPDEPAGEPGTCEPSDAESSCQACVAAQCCEEQELCNATGPDSACGFGSTLFESRVVESGEIGCMMECFAGQTERGVFAGSVDDLHECETRCGASECGGGKATAPTVSLASCIIGLKQDSDGCAAECGFLP